MTSLTLEAAMRADVAGDIVHAADLYWLAFNEGFDDPEAALYALAVYFELTDYGVYCGLGLTVGEVEQAGDRFDFVACWLQDNGRRADAEAWRWWFGEIGSGEQRALPGGLAPLMNAGSREAAWLMVAVENAAGAALEITRDLRAELINGTTRSRYVDSMTSRAFV